MPLSTEFLSQYLFSFQSISPAMSETLVMSVLRKFYSKILPLLSAFIYLFSIFILTVTPGADAIKKFTPILGISYLGV